MNYLFISYSFIVFLRTDNYFSISRLIWLNRKTRENQKIFIFSRRKKKGVELMSLEMIFFQNPVIITIKIRNFNNTRGEKATINNNRNQF